MYRVLESIAIQMETLHTVRPLWEIEDWKDHYLGFTQIEIGKVRRIIDWFDEPMDEEEQNKLRRNFYNFIQAHDKRRDTNFKETFPELAEFLDECGKL